MPKSKPTSDLLKNPLKIEQWPIDRLVPYIRNPRKNDAVVDKMVSAIEEFGFRIPIVAKSDGSVVDGHLRLKAARKLGMDEVPVALADELTDAQVKAFRILANRSANWADWDIELLSIELQELADAEFNLDLTGLNGTEIQDVLDAVDINFSHGKEKGLDGKGFNSGSVKVNVVLPPGCVAILEEAIAATGEQNRAEAVRIICEAYLAKR